MSPAKTGSPRERSRQEALRRYARELRRRGFTRIAGADEAGAGPLAGPLVAAAVILPEGVRLPGVDDSKKLSAAARARWAEAIRERSVAHAVVEVGVRELERIGPYQAALAGMRRAVLALDPAPDYLLVDARHLPELELPQESFVRGDGKHLAIAAASVLAKEHRDALMRDYALEYPEYGFERHKGYGTAAHLDALERMGPTPIHRRSYAPVRRVLERQERLFP